VCTQSAKSALTGSISTHKSQKKQRKNFFAGSVKPLPQGVHSHRKNSNLV
jgi:hypothetical protein